MPREHPAISDLQLRAAHILVQHGFSNSLAATLLHVNRTTLAYWLKKFRTQLQWEQLQRQLRQQELQQETELRQTQAQTQQQQLPEPSTLTVQQQQLHEQQRQFGYQLHAQLQWQQQQLLQQLARLQQQQQAEHQQFLEQRAQLDVLLGVKNKGRRGGEEEEQKDSSGEQESGQDAERNDDNGEHSNGQRGKQKSANSGEAGDVDMDQGVDESLLSTSLDRFPDAAATGPIPTQDSLHGVQNTDALSISAGD